MASEGPLSPGTMADDAAVGDYIWADPDNAKVSNDTYATSSCGLFETGDSHYLKATNFGFAIPAGATINGIIVENEWWNSPSNSWQDTVVKIVKSDGSIGTTNRGKDVNVPNTKDVYDSWGAEDDLWGESWEVEDINHANFGVVFSAHCSNILNALLYCDHIRITIYYTPGAPPVNPYPTGRLNKKRISGYHCFMDAFLRAKREGFDPLKLPDGTVF